MDTESKKIMRGAIAALVMPQLVARAQYTGAIFDHPMVGEENRIQVARTALALADALLKELNL